MGMKGYSVHVVYDKNENAQTSQNVSSNRRFWTD